MIGRDAALVATALAALTGAVGCGGDDVARPAATGTTHVSLIGIDVTGLTVREATARLEARGWVPVGDKDPDDHYGDYGGSYVLLPADPTWIVCGQDFSRLVDGTRDLFLSAAPSCGETTMPNLVGRTYGDAQAVAESLGLFLHEETAGRLANLGPDWTICEHEPAAGRFDRGEVDEMLVYVEPAGGC